MSRSPQTIMNQMMINNPQMKQVMDYINANGGDAKGAFYKKAQEMGIDPDEFIKSLM